MSRTLFGLAVAAMIIGAAGHGFAQDATTQSIFDQLARFERDIAQLQRLVFRDGVPPQPAAGETPVGATAGQAARHESRISQLEEQFRVLTGEVEETRFALTRIQDSLDRLAADIDLRLADLERRGVGNPPETETETEPLAAGAPDGPATGPQTAGTVTTTDQSGTVIIESDPNAARYETMGELGTVQTEMPTDGAPPAGAPSGESATRLAAAGTAAPAATVSNAQGDYDAAYGLLRQASYGEAEAAFQQFIQTYPEHALVANAYYWLGETYYVRADYEKATVAFARGYKSDPSSNKAPDNLLKLGLSFMAMNKNPEACATFAKLTSDHGDAPKPIRDRVDRERRRAGCG